MEKKRKGKTQKEGVPRGMSEKDEITGAAYESVI